MCPDAVEKVAGVVVEAGNRLDLSANIDFCFLPGEPAAIEFACNQRVSMTNGDVRGRARKEET